MLHTVPFQYLHDNYYYMQILLMADEYPTVLQSPSRTFSTYPPESEWSSLTDHQSEDECSAEIQSRA